MSTSKRDLNDVTRRGSYVLVRLQLKGCPRYKGDVVVELDQGGWYEECIQCGYLHDLQYAVKAKQQAAQREQNKKC